MKIQLKNIGILLLIYILFMYGFIVGEYKIFPYKFLKNIISNKSQTDTSQNSSKFLYGRWSRLRGTELTSPDIRAGMAMVLAALCAEGISEIQNVIQIERGYENLVERLKKLGARIDEIN